MNYNQKYFIFLRLGIYSKQLPLQLSWSNHILGVGLSGSEFLQGELLKVDNIN